MSVEPELAPAAPPVVLPPSRVHANLVANLAGKGVTAAVAFAFVPLYVRYLGIESYGLVGFFASMQAVFNIFDLGLTRTLNREMARYSASDRGLGQSRNLVRTLETIYWPTGLLIGLIVLLGAPYIASNWLTSKTLSPETIRQALLLMGIALALQWPASLYFGGLAGLQRMVRQNVLTTAIQVVRGVGALLLLRYYSQSIVTFFAWQLIMSAVQTAVGALNLWWVLPPGEGRARFSRPLLESVWRFAWDMTLLSLVTVALTQADKFILSRKLPLDAFGYYNLAFIVGSALYYIAYPVSSTFFPRLAQLAATGDDAAAARAYHSGSQVMSVLVGPAALTVVLFAPEILLAWTRSAVTAGQTTTLVRFLMVGTLLNCFMLMPYGLQIAYGWTRLAVYSNLVALAIDIPLLIVLIGRYGAVGAASVWVLLNLGYFVISVNIIHTRLLPSEKWRWYGGDVLAPLFAVAVVVGTMRFLLPSVAGVPRLIGVVGATMAMATGAAMLAAPEARKRLLAVLR